MKPFLHGQGVDRLHRLALTHGDVRCVGGVDALQAVTPVERVLTSCAGLPAGDVEPLMMLLRRYATEAAREEARLFCDELVEMDNLVPANDTGRRMVVAA